MNITRKEGFEFVVDYINRINTLETNLKGIIADMGEAKDIPYGTEEYEFKQNLNATLGWLGYAKRSLKFAKAMMED